MIQDDFEDDDLDGDLESDDDDMNSNEGSDYLERFVILFCFQNQILDLLKLSV